VSPVAAPVGAPRVEPRRRHTTYPAAAPWAPAYRPGGPGQRQVSGPPGHRNRPVHLGCGDPRAAARAAALRRRHILLGIVALLAAIALAVPWGTKADPTLAVPAAAGVGTTLSPHSVYVVQPGDTLVSIAQRIGPSSGRRAALTALNAEVGGAGVRPGERLVLP